MMMNQNERKRIVSVEVKLLESRLFQTKNQMKNPRWQIRKAGRKAKNGAVESDSDSDDVNPTVKKPKRL